MVYNILFRCWNVLPETHFTKEPTRQILGKQFLHHYSYPWTISRHTKDSLFNCILHKKKLNGQTISMSLLNTLVLYWTFSEKDERGGLIGKDWVTVWLGEEPGTLVIFQNGNLFQICPLSPSSPPSPFPPCCRWVPGEESGSDFFGLPTR